MKKRGREARRFCESAQILRIEAQRRGFAPRTILRAAAELCTVAAVTSTALRHLLSGGDRRSAAQSKRVRAIVERHPERVAELAHLANDPDWLVSMRALDLLEKIAHHHAEWVRPHRQLFIGPLADSNQWEIQLQVVRALPCFRWTRAETRRVHEILRKGLHHPQKFVRAWALDSLAQFARHDRQLLPAVIRGLEEFERSGSKSLETRARHIRADHLEQGGASLALSRTAPKRQGSEDEADGKNTPIPWMLDGDPAIRWQTLRDLVGAAKKVVEREREKISTNGWGARLLAEQSRDGRWADGKSSDGGLYLPKWTSTIYTMMTLRDFGLSPANPQAQRACKLLLDQGLRPGGGIAYGAWAKRHTRGETCVTAMTLSILSYFEVDDVRLDIVAARLLEDQMADGGWNCRRPSGATHASVHTTISVLEGLRHYERRERKLAKVRAAQRRGRDFLLAHRLFRSHRTGRIIRPEFLKFSFPPRWHYDVLRALDYFQLVDAPQDERLAEVIDIVRSRRQPTGRWLLENRYPGKTYFELERIGAPSRWNTLRALRVLKWWGRGTARAVFAPAFT